MTENATKQTAYIAGGCFWGMQELLRNIPGVLETEVGYTGGWLDHHHRFGVARLGIVGIVVARVV